MNNKEFADLHGQMEQPDPIVECCICEESGPQSGAEICENCKDIYCPECAKADEGMTTWRDMEVCSRCKGDLTADKGPDPNDYNY